MENTKYFLNQENKKKYKIHVSNIKVVLVNGIQKK